MKLLRALPRKKAAWLGLCLAAMLIFSPLAMASGGEGGHGSDDWKTWKNVDTQKVFNFVILFGALIYLVRKPAANALAGRIEDIQKELDDLETRRKAAADEVATINARLQDLEGEAQKIVDDYVRQGEAAREKILAEARKAADRLTDQAQRHMEHEVADAKKRLRAEILEKAIVMGEQLISKNITEQDQDRLVGEYLDKVVTQ